MSAFWTGVLGELERVGLNTVGVVAADSVPSAGEVLPGCRSVVVVASGGSALWEAFVAACRADPRVLTDHDHPLDRFIARALAAADPSPPASRLWVRCAADAERFIDFRPLARAAGLGWPSRLGLLIHPDHGPWLGLRAACFTTELLAPSDVLPGLGPCDGCSAPCAEACPVSAVAASAGDPQEAGDRFDIGACAQHKQAGGCLGMCHARRACPHGAASRYPDLEQRYHDDRIGGRRALAEWLSVADERVGVGPHWDAWVASSVETALVEST